MNRAARLLRLAYCEAPGPGQTCDDTVQPFGPDELILLLLGCGVLIGAAIFFAATEIRRSTAAIFGAAGLAFLAFVVWRIHHPEIPFGSDEALLAGVALVSAGLSLRVRRRRRMADEPSGSG